MMNGCLLLRVLRVWFLGQTRITLFYAPRHRVNFLCDLFYYDYQGLLIRHQGNFPRRVGHSLLPCTIRLASSLTMSKILFFCHADTYPAICTLQRTPDTSNNGATVVVHQIPKFNVSHGVWNDSEIRMLIAGRWEGNCALHYPRRVEDSAQDRRWWIGIPSWDSVDIINGERLVWLFGVVVIFPKFNKTIYGVWRCLFCKFKLSQDRACTI